MNGKAPISPGRTLLVVGASLFLLSGSTVMADPPRSADSSSRRSSITDTSLHWPGMDAILRTLALRDYNTRVVVIGTTLLGIAAGVIGTFAYLRKRSMMGDALSHATLPGIALVFLLIGSKHFLLLLCGAAASGILGVLCVIGLRRGTRLAEDAAIGIVLSVFFGVGMVLFSLIVSLRAGNEAGLLTYIYGQAAAMLMSDAKLIGGSAIVIIGVCTLLYKEFRLVCFDQEYAAVQGRPVVLIDIVMMGLVVLTTVIGLQAVGLILIVALLIIPAAAARFWTDRLDVMMILAGVFGALSGWMGSTVSALLPRMPAGAVIVIAGGVVFFISMLLAPHRGVVAEVVRRRLVQRKVADQHLLRALAEFEEQHGEGFRVKLQDILLKRSWTRAELDRVISRARRKGTVALGRSAQFHLTLSGRPEAKRILRNHRLWEMYLIRHADIAPSHVDRDADEVEHVLSPEIIEELERALHEKMQIPPSPHPEGATT